MSANLRSQTGAGRLLMVRKAGASFTGEMNIRSQIFEGVIAEYDSLGEEIDLLCERLCERLYQAVPQTNNRAERNLLLRVRRAIFNHREVEERDENVLTNGLREEVRRYNNFWRARRELLSANRHAIFSELRTQLMQLVRDEGFRSATEYSCPWLLDKFHSTQLTGERQFTNEERALHSYAVKFFSKANPFYTFASAGFPPTYGLQAHCECEVVLNTSLILKLEQTLLPLVGDPNRRLSYLQSFIICDKVFRFLVFSKDALRLVSLKDNPLLRRVAAFFQDQSRRHTIEECAKFILEELPSVDRAVVEQYIGLLTRQGILIEYLVTDFNRFGEELAMLSPGHEELLADLRRFHLGCFTKAELPYVHEHLSKLSLRQEAASETFYYVNTYESSDAEAHERRAQSLYEDLHLLKPFFSDSNFSDRAAVIENFLLDRVKVHPKRAIPYLELVSDFLRRPQEIIAHYQSVINSFDERQAHAAWLRLLPLCAGHLTDETRAALLAKKPVAQRVDIPLCFNGSFDYVEGVYYLVNIFAGGGRYASRYLLHQGAIRYQPAKADSQWLDVQLVVPFKDNRSYTAALLPSGCGFEARYKHQFEEWINPSQILVRERDGRIIYQDSVSERFLRFHFFGFVLADRLPTHYQLLLAHHADFYHNPFELNALLPTDTPSTEPRHIPSLSSGSVCLRREQWVFTHSAFDTVCHQEDILASTVRLRDLVRSSTGASGEDWYFRAPQPGYGKPRYLDLRNPLSVQTFCKTLKRLPPDADVFLALMTPPVSHLYMGDERPLLTELMIEI